MSHRANTPRDYGISINVAVTNYNANRNPSQRSFDLVISTNVGTWSFQRSISEIQQLHAQLRRDPDLRSIKLPRGIHHLSPSRCNDAATNLIEQYLWRLFRRAHVFQSQPIRSFIKTPLAVQSVITALSKKTNSVLRDDRLQYLRESVDRKQSATDQSRWTQLRCILYSGYILEGYTIDNFGNSDDHKREHLTTSALSQSIGSKHPFFRVDVVEIKRVVRFQKAHKLTLYLHRGEPFSIRCSDRSTFREWTEEIRNMINLRDGYSPYLIRWTEQDDAASIGSEDGSTDRVYAPSMDSADSKALDDRVDVDIISCFNLSDESGLDVEDSVDEF